MRGKIREMKQEGINEGVKNIEYLCLEGDSVETGFGSKGESCPMARNSARASSTP